MSSSAGSDLPSQSPAGWLQPVQLSLAADPEERITTAAPVLGVYRIAGFGRRQTGVIADALVDAYSSGGIRGHEQTRTARQQALIADLDEVEALIGPAVLAHRPAPALADLVRRLASGPPSATWLTPDSVRHDLWLVDGEQLDPLLTACAALDPLYIIDGHHRIAAASQRAEARRLAGHAGAAGPPSRFLAAVFPTDELAVHAYHRVVDLSAGPSPAQLLTQLSERCDLAPVDDVVAARPGAAGEFGLGLAGRWYRFRLRRETTAAANRKTDVELLDDVVLGPIIGIADPRTDDRIDFVADVEDPQMLIDRSLEPDRACFLVSPLTIDEVLAAADAGRALPPKSTWFDPKPITGAVLPVRPPPVRAGSASTRGQPSRGVAWGDP